jgi:hypothetical protein
VKGFGFITSIAAGICLATGDVTIGIVLGSLAWVLLPQERTIYERDSGPQGTPQDMARWN